MHSVRVFKSAEELADILAHEITLKINASANPGKPFSIALEGGSTPEMLYSLLAEKYAQLIPWKIVHLYLGDERCVPLTHAESNFGMIKRILINKVKIPDSNIHPAPVEAIAVEAAKL